MTVVVTARSQRRAEEAAAAARAAWRGGGAIAGEIVPVVMDNADLDSVRSAAEDIVQRFPKVDLLVNNAGVMAPPELERTKQGHELQLGVNHLSHFELTNRLLPALRAAGSSRVVCIASSASVGNVTNPKDRASIDFEDPNFERHEYSPLGAYSSSKLANVLHARGLAGRLEGGAAKVILKIPGVRKALTSLLFGNNFLDVVDGAQTTLHCALDPSVPDHPGAFFSQTGPYGGAKIMGRGFTGGWPMRNPNPLAEDAEQAERLWSISETLVGPGPAEPAPATYAEASA